MTDVRVRLSGGEIPEGLRGVTRSFGRYEIHGLLGRGGMGAVHAALDTELQRAVALKICSSADDDFVRRFAAEAQATSQLEHPGIVPVYEFGRTPDGDFFYTMKLVRGRSLSAMLKEGAPLPRLLSIFRSVADAVAYAHSRGVIHRDLKPDNVMIGEFGDVLVMDWGLARVVGATEAAGRGRGSGGDGLTLAGDILGTPQYMAPEQARGEAVDTRSDVYALGAILYRLLAGRAPIAATTALEAVERAATGMVDPLPSEGILPELAAIVARAMDLDPAQRYPSAQALAEDVTSYLEGRPVGAATYSSWQLLKLWLRLHRWKVAAAAAVLAGVVVTMAGGRLASRAEARGWAERAQRTLEAAGEDREAALSAHLAAAELLSRAHAELGEDVREERVRVGRRLCELALDGGDFMLARQAALDLARFGVPASEVEALAAQVETRRADEREAERRRLAEAIDDLRAGLDRYKPNAPPFSIGDYVAIVSSFRDPRIGRTVAEELAKFTARGAAPLTAGERDMVKFLTQTLGLSKAPEAVPALAAWMAVVEDQDLAGVCAQALGRTGSADAVLPLAEARRRFGSRAPAGRAADGVARKLPVPDPWPEPRTIDDILTRAQAHAMRGDHGEAAESFKRAIEREPSNPAVWIARAEHMPATGWNDIREALRLDPDFAPALVMEGAAYYSEAVRVLKGGDVVQASALLRRALASMDRGLELQPVERTGALLNRYNIHRRFGSGAADRFRATGDEEEFGRAVELYEAGIADLTRLFELEPWDVNLLGYRATLKREIGELYREAADSAASLRWFLDALQDADRAVHEAPRYDGLMSRGKILMAVERYEAARADFERSIVLSSSEPLPHYNLGLLLHDHLGRPAEARAAFERFLELNKDPRLAEEARRRMESDF